MIEIVRTGYRDIGLDDPRALVIWENADESHFHEPVLRFHNLVRDKNGRVYDVALRLGELRERLGCFRAAWAMRRGGYWWKRPQEVRQFIVPMLFFKIGIQLRWRGRVENPWTICEPQATLRFIWRCCREFVKAAEGKL